MAEDTLNFSIMSRFYVICFYNKGSTLETIKTKMLEQLNSISRYPIESLQLNDVTAFKFKMYSFLGYFEFQLQTLSLERKIQPTDLMTLSQNIEKLIHEINNQYGETIFLDIYDPPYTINIAENTQLSIKWSEQNINEYKMSLGKWIEFYSGQFSDYSPELYQSRIENNLSNRLSEVHFIRVNSSFIYMSFEWWNIPSGAKDYMQKYFIHQILSFKALHFSFYVLNEELDNTNSRLTRLDVIPLKILEAEIDSIDALDRLVARLTDNLLKERIINRRSHSKKVLETCLKIFEIEILTKQTKEKLDRLKGQLIEARAVQQEKLANQQKTWLLLLNLIFGSSILFTIGNEIKAQVNPSNPGYLRSLLGPTLSNSLYNGLVDQFILLLIIIMASIAVIGLLYTILIKRLGILSPKVKKSVELNKTKLDTM